MIECLDAIRSRRGLVPLFVLSILLTGSTAALATGAETLILFDPSAGETPESIVFDRQDNAYISLAFTGEIRKVAPDFTDESLAFLPLGAPCPIPKPTVLLGLAIDPQDRLYGALSACDPANHGIWKISTTEGTAERVIELPPTVIANGIDIDQQQIYMADTFGGRILRASQFGGAVEVWADDPLLAQDLNGLGPGPNGIRVFRRTLYVANSSTGTIVAIPIETDGAAGTPFVYATLPNGQGCDEFVFDVLGRLYCTTDPFNTIVRLDPDGSSEILLTADDLLDGPTSVAFGRGGENRKNLYITNAAFPIFTQTFRPSLMRLEVDAPGAP